MKNVSFLWCFRVLTESNTQEEKRVMCWHMCVCVQERLLHSKTDRHDVCHFIWLQQRHKRRCLCCDSGLRRPTWLFCGINVKLNGNIKLILSALVLGYKVDSWGFPTAVINWKQLSRVHSQHWVSGRVTRTGRNGFMNSFCFYYGKIWLIFLKLQPERFFNSLWLHPLTLSGNRSRVLGLPFPQSRPTFYVKCTVDAAMTFNRPLTVGLPLLAAVISHVASAFLSNFYFLTWLERTQVPGYHSGTLRGRYFIRDIKHAAWVLSKPPADWRGCFKGTTTYTEYKLQNVPN